MIIALIFFTIMSIIYNYLIFELINRILKGAYLKKEQRILVSIVNTLLIAVFINIETVTDIGIYVILAMLMFVEFSIFYKDKLLRNLFCMLACMVHAMAIRGVCVAIFAIALDKTLFAIIDDWYLHIISTGTLLLCLNIALVLIMKFISTKNIKVLTQDNDQLFFMTAWMAIFCIYLVINAGVYLTPKDDLMLIINQIAGHISILIGVYLVLFFAIRTSTLLGYKEKTELLQQTVEKERQYRMSIDKNVFRIIEVNYSTNQILSGFEDYYEQLGNTIYNYSAMLAYMIQTTVHSEDREAFLKYSSPIIILEAFKQGETEVTFDYRRLMPDGNYVWMQVMMVYIKEESTNHIKGFMQIKDIDEEKKQQIDLQYKAERDMLTSLYNKGTTEKLIEEYLMNNQGTDLSGTLMVIDIDNFKMINDRLGHLYGDVVLSDLSESLRTIFREEDIVGRIGGDEFLVFAKGLLDRKLITSKAKAVCKAFFRTYTSERKEECTVSSSLGIAFFPSDGKDFDTLFKNADAALYATKATGKNGYSFFGKELESSYVSPRTQIDNRGMMQKSFKDNRIEYVFRLLYGSDDTRNAIESVLELIAKNFRFSRANIFEFNEVSTHFNGVFEWCDVGIDSVNANYVDMPLSSFAFVVTTLENGGGMFQAIPSDFPAQIQEHYLTINIKSIVHFSIQSEDKLIGVIAFQNCVEEDIQILDTEIEELRVICQVLSIFMAKQLSSTREQLHHKAIEAVMDNMNSIAYVVDRETYEVFYENQNVLNITGHSSIGMQCFRSYRGLEIPCPDCALNLLTEECPRCTQDLYTEKFDLYTQTSGTLIEWENTREALLISSVDITEYKREEKEKQQRELDGINVNFDKQLNELISRTQIGTWDWELKSGKVIYDESWAALLGYKKDELVQTVETWEGMVLPEDLLYANEQIDRHFRGETPIYEAEFRMIRKDGSIIWAQDKGNVSEVDEQGNPVRFVGVLQDVSRIKNAEMRLKENQATLDLAVNVAELGTWDWDLVANKIEYNDEYLYMLGLSQSDMNGSMEEWEGTNHPEDLPRTIKALDAYLAGEIERYECEIRMRHKDGHFIWTRDVGRVVARDANGKPTRLIGGHLNIDELKRSQEKLNQIAYYDELTGLANLAKFKIEAKEILEQYPEKPFMLLKIDVVNFKIINDMFGTEVGDAVIKKIGEVIQCVRAESKMQSGSVARVHDDVYIIIDESYEESIDEINRRTQLFEKLFNEQMAELLGNHKVKFCYGRYFPQLGETDIDNAIECTTLALSRAKRDANAGVSYFDFDITVKQQMRRDVELANKMHQALEDKEFQVYLQGKYSLVDERLCGAESLVRWRMDEHTLIQPNDFIPIFEQNGSIIKLDMFMFEQCCCILTDWKKQGFSLIPISVNFSRRHLANQDFAEDLLEIARKYDVDPKYLEVELTETIVMDLEYDIAKFVASLHACGFQMSIDDFGTGYSSLGMLTNLNVDTIKLDRSFFLNAQENVRVHAVLSNLLNMAIDLNIKTVAEGVEEKIHLDLLGKLNCDVIQGYYFGRPIPVAEFTIKMLSEVRSIKDAFKNFNMRKNNELLIEMVDAMPLAFILWDESLNIVQCNKEAARFVGYHTEEELIAGAESLLQEDQPPERENIMDIVTHYVQQAFQQGYGQYQWDFQHIDSDILPCEVTLVRIVNKGKFMVICYAQEMRVPLQQGVEGI